jgi:hypothetical protein
MASVPHDVLQALFDRYGVTCPLASASAEDAHDGDGTGDAAGP